MKIQKRARLTPLRLEEMAQSVIELRLTTAEAVRIDGVCSNFVVGWVRRYM